MPLERRKLTNSQLLIWLGLIHEPDAPIYNMITTCRISGPVDEGAFSTAFQTVVDDCDALRTVFDDDGEGPRRLIRERLASGIELVDLSWGENPEEALSRWIDERRGAVLDLRSRAFHCALLRVSERCHVWYFNQHHLVSDAWSTALVYRTTVLRYAAIMRGAAQPASNTTAFERFVEEERALQSSPACKRSQRHWRERAGGAGAPEPRFYGLAPARPSTVAKRVRVELGARRSARLRERVEDRSLRSINRDLTAFQIFLTALFAFLHRVTGERSLAVGAPSANRATRERRSTVGLLMEMFSLHVEVERGDSLRTVFERVRRESIEFLRHATPGSSDPVAMRAFRVVLNYVKAQFGDFDGRTAVVEFLSSGHVEPHHALRVQVHDPSGNGEPSLDFDLNVSAFSTEARRVAPGHFMRLLDAFLEDPDTRIEDVDILSPDERRSLLLEMNDTVAENAIRGRLEALFTSAAARHPDLAAVVDEDGALGYRELDERSGAMAEALRARGVVPGGVVAISLPRGSRMVTAMLGALKAGCAYLPVDMDLPARRRASLIERSGAAAAITEDGPCAPDRSDAPPGDRVEARPSGACAPGGGAGDLAAAYVLYTSGSTGEPKGVVCRHRGVVNLLCDFEDRAPLRPGAACSWWTSEGFDVSVYEIYSALLFGRTLHVVPDRVRADADALYVWLDERSIESAYIPPFMLGRFRELADLAPEPMALRRLLVGVEPIPEPTLAALAAATPGLRIVNGYGPTEATICTSLYSVAPGAGGDRRTPIGRPVRNTRAYVLDERLEPVPLGMPGELYVAGDGLAVGYLDDDALTAARFVPDPFAAGDERMYRTGDVVRYLDDGNLQFLGRADHQIKLHGTRIEPGEIESRLVGHPAVRAALVAAVDDGRGGEALVAYLVTRDTPNISASEWFQFLRADLPASMIPAAYVVLEAFPLTSSGKIDRAALPRPSLGEAPGSDDRTPPRTPEESRLAAIWCEALRLDAVGVHAHFIDLGGDSITALRIAALAHQAGIALRPRQVFESQTIAGLARDVEARATSSPAPQAGAGSEGRQGPSGAGRRLSDEELDDLLSELDGDDG